MVSGVVMDSEDVEKIRSFKSCRTDVVVVVWDRVGAAELGGGIVFVR